MLTNHRNLNCLSGNFVTRTQSQTHIYDCWLKRTRIYEHWALSTQHEQKTHMYGCGCIHCVENWEWELGIHRIGQITWIQQIETNNQTNKQAKCDWVFGIFYGHHYGVWTGYIINVQSFPASCCFGAIIQNDNSPKK